MVTQKTKLLGLLAGDVDMDATIERIDDLVEEEVTLRVNGIETVGFAGICPYPIEVGHTYPVSLTLDIFDEYDVRPVSDQAPSMHRIDRGFSYLLIGRLVDDVFDAGIQFRDKIFLRDFAYLIGKTVAVKVDRINVEFLPG